MVALEAAANLWASLLMLVRARLPCMWVGMSTSSPMQCWVVPWRARCALYPAANGTCTLTPLPPPLLPDPQVFSAMPHAMLTAVTAITAAAFALKGAPLLAVMSGVGAPLDWLTVGAGLAGSDFPAGQCTAPPSTSASPSQPSQPSCCPKAALTL